jgi:hypothetical protein
MVFHAVMQSVSQSMTILGSEYWPQSYKTRVTLAKFDDIRIRLYLNFLGGSHADDKQWVFDMIMPRLNSSPGLSKPSRNMEYLT